MIHSPELLGQLSAFPSETFSGDLFRTTRLSLDPLAPSTSGGRWAPRNGCAVLYTSLEREGALAEISFHWSQLLPLPSKPVMLHQLRIELRESLRLLRADLATLGVELSRYDAMDYRRTQEIGAAASFLEFHGLIVPSARWPCDNLILFAENQSVSETAELVTSESVE